MGFTGPLPDSFTRLIAVEHRKAAHIPPTLDEACAKGLEVREKELQQNIESMLNLRGIEANRSRMDRRKTDRVGWPDFTFALPCPGRYGVPCAVEVKVPGKNPTAEQERMLGLLAGNGWATAVIRSEREFLDWLEKIKTEVNL